MASEKKSYILIILFISFSFFAILHYFPKSNFLPHDITQLKPARAFLKLLHFKENVVTVLLKQGDSKVLHCAYIHTSYILYLVKQVN